MLTYELWLALMHYFQPFSAASDPVPIPSSAGVARRDGGVVPSPCSRERPTRGSQPEHAAASVKGQLFVVDGTRSVPSKA
jgi:hypothetical protein